MRLTELQGDARPIAVARVGLGVATIMNAAEIFALLSQIASGKLAMPVFPGTPHPSMTSVYVYVVVAVLAGTAITIGWHASRAAVASTLISVFVFFWDQQTYSSHRLLATLLVGYLIFACSDAKWSLRQRERFVPWWPQLLMMTQLSVCYLFAAVSKINGVFIFGGPLAHWIGLPLPRWVFFLIAVATIVLEIFLAFAFWFRPSRRLAVILGLLFHSSIVVLMRDQTLPLIAFSLTCISVYGLFAFRPATQPMRGSKPLPAPLQTGERFRKP